MTKHIIDLDDFAESNMDWDLITRLKEISPNLKLNIFTIPGRCSWQFIEETRKIDWIRMYPHGHIHSTSRECQDWSYNVIDYHLRSLEQENWPKVWKSPGWQSSQDVLQCLADRKWIIADQEYNNDRRPEGLRAYLLDSPFKIHGHIGHWGSHNDNSLEYIFDAIAVLRGEFGFIDDLWE